MNSQSLPATESKPYFFNSRELARLAVYRAAVVARFYTDQCEPTVGSYSVEATTRLLTLVGGEQQAA
jgi:hypothetical protein